MFFLKEKNKTQNTMRGFTLVETLVAISILLVAVVAPLVLITSNITAVFSIKDKITALYLAEDAIDYIKYRIDTNYNKFDADNSTFWLDGIPCIEDNGRCEVDSFNNPIVINTCAGIITGISGGTNGCAPLQIDPNTGAYGYTAGWVNSKFYRTVRIKDEGSNPDEQKIEVAVFWQDHGVDKNFLIIEHVFHWR